MKPYPKYLTKSRYRLAMDCRAKLFYTGKSDYVDNKIDDPFLKALAEGGFQVGALAQQYYPGGVLIDEKNHLEAVRQTAEVLRQTSIVLFEAAFLYKNLFIRADIVEKHGNELHLVEVKAKSYDGDDDVFYLKNTSIPKSDWE